MSKTAANTAEFTENAEFAAFDASKATDQFRAFAEKGMEQSKETFAKLKSGAEDTQKALETSFEAARTAGGDLSLKAISTLRTNTEVGFAHLEAMVAAKSLAELFELQTAFLRHGAEAAVQQAKDFQTLSTKAAEDVAKPFKDVFERTFKELKVA